MNTNAIEYAGQLAGIAFAGLMETFAKPADLQPTNYCTAMWNGQRCFGVHTVHNGRTYHTTPFDPTADYFLGGAMWTTGGITRDLRTQYVLERMSDVPNQVCDNVDVELDASAALEEGFMPINRIWGHLIATPPRTFDELIADGWTVCGALTEDA